jgi:hypothetical protein
VTDAGAKKVGLVFTVLVHAALVGGVAAAAHFDKARIEARATQDDSKLNHIEAGLAIRSKSAAGRKTKQPQKDTHQAVKPTDLAVSNDPDAASKPKDKKPKDQPEDIDPSAAMQHARQLGEKTDQSTQTSTDPGAEDQSTKGRPDGSDFGRLEDQKGDPYVGELIGRMTVNPELEVPATVPQEGKLETWGCVKLSADGKIADAFLDPDHKSGNAAFNSAVLRRVKATTDMERAVPGTLKQMLVEEGACFPYRY